MAEKFSFFDPVQDENGLFDREYNAQEFTDYFSTLVTTGVMKGAGNQLSVSADGASMQTKLNTGVAFVEGRYYAIDSVMTHVHDTEVVGKDRIDRIVIRLDLSTESRYVKSFVKKGVASTSPVAPSLTQTPSLYEISVAQVKVIGGQTFISASNVIDERGTNIICPWAGSKILPSFDDNALAQHINNNLLHKQGTDVAQIWDNANAEGLATLAGSLGAHAEGTYTIAARKTVYEVAALDNTLKKLTLPFQAGLSVGLEVILRQPNKKSIVGVTIKELLSDNKSVILNTTEDITGTTHMLSKVATNTPTHAEGNNTMATGAQSHAEGNGTFATGDNSHAEGEMSRAEGKDSHAEGFSCKTTGAYAHAEGMGTRATGNASHAEGSFTEANSDSAHAEGYYAIANGMFSHAQGSDTKAEGNYSHAGGSRTTASGVDSFAMGADTRANVNHGFAIGNTNKDMAVTDAFVIGNGEVPLGTRQASNAFRVTTLGAVYGKAAYNSTGADYAEYFEWLDGNIEAEERQGFFVTMDGDKIRKATSDDDYILGVVSVNPSIIGDSHQDAWNKQYVTDEWGRIQFHWVEVPEIKNAEGKIIQEAYQEYRPITNPEHNWDEEYIPREERPEWSPVGIVGKLLVRDDGTCEVNGFCSSNDEGIATKSDTGYRVMERVSKNIVRVFVK